MKIRKTTSVLPLIMGLVGGILGIVAGLCNGLCADVLDEIGVTGINTTLIYIGGYGLLAVSVMGLVTGCIARRVKTGSFLQLVSGILSLICAALLWVGSDGFPGIFVLAPVVLFIVGGILGMLKPAND